MSPAIQGDVESMAHGGQGVIRIDGKVHFVPGALPGATVRFEVTEDHARWARGHLLSVVEPGPFSARAVCGHAEVCGGCQWQQADLVAQRGWKRQIVVEQLERVGRIPDPPVAETRAAGPPYGYRNRMDYAVDDGALALHRRRSADLVSLDECPVVRPEIEMMLRDIAAPGSSTVTLRVGVRTGETLAVIDGPLPDGAAEWGTSVCTVTKGTAQPLLGASVFHEVVAGARFRVSGPAFFQNNTDGADALCELVAGVAGRGGTLIDLYAGGGLFSCTVGRRFDRVIGIESAGLATSDFRHNASGLDHVELHRVAVERASSLLAGHEGSTIIADPPRVGLGRKGTAVIVDAAPCRVVLVSCDPASLGRDAGLMREAGYRLVGSTPLDMFPQTFHVEVISLFEPA